MVTPETTNYMIAGYVVFFSVFTFYILSMVVRWSRLKRTLQDLKDLEVKE